MMRRSSSVPPGSALVATTDTLVEGVHFLPGAPAASIGHRALAVNLSDLAAMGARPAWALLALTLPQAQEAWLQEFAAGLGALAHEHDVALVGGDTTRGPLCVTVQLLGLVAADAALRRSGAGAGDTLFVSGTPGDAAAGLALEQRRLEADTRSRRLSARALPAADPARGAGERLRDYASACIDVSDGLFGDAGKLAQASGVALEVLFEALPVSEALRATLGDEGARLLALSGGDDYELCFAVPADKVTRLARAAAARAVGLRAHRLSARGRRRTRAARRFCDGVLAFRLPAFQLKVAKRPRRRIRVPHRGA